MIGVKFVAQCVKTKTKMYSSMMYFKALEESTLILIKAQRVNLELKFPTHRILTLITNEDSGNDIHLTPHI
jgi:hypothetical protein